MDAGTFYVVSGGIRIRKAIPFDSLTLSNHGRKLAPNKTRGYSRVWLPSGLLPWYDRACGEWDKNAAKAPFKHAVAASSAR